MLGKVKFFKDSAGWGIIVPDHGGDDVFCHFTAIKDVNGYRSLQSGQIVEYECEQTEKGLAATSVTVIPVPVGSV